MKGLLLKDFYQIKYTIRVYGIIVLLFFCCLCIFNNLDFDNLFFLFFLEMIFSLSITLPISILFADEKSKYTNTALTMPVSRTIIVIEKYIFSLITPIIIFILTLIPASTGNIPSINIISISATFSICTIIISFLLPIAFRFSAQYAMMSLGISFLIIALLGFVFEELLYIDIFTYLSDYILYFLPLIALVCYIISATISIYIYKNKSF